MDSTGTTLEIEIVISSSGEIVEDYCLASKTVEDKGRILIDTNDTKDLGKIILNGIERDNLTRDQIYIL